MQARGIKSGCFKKKGNLLKDMERFAWRSKLRDYIAGTMPQIALWNWSQEATTAAVLGPETTT